MKYKLHIIYPLKTAQTQPHANAIRQRKPKKRSVFTLLYLLAIILLVLVILTLHANHE